MPRVLILALCCLALAAGEAPPWAAQHGRDEQGAWAVLACPAAPLRARMRLLPDGTSAWLAERALTTAEFAALGLPGTADGTSWEQALAACAAIERLQPRVRLHLPPLAWLRAAPPAGVRRAWAGDLRIVRVPAVATLGGARIDPHLFLPVWGEGWSAAEAPPPPTRGERPGAPDGGEEPTPAQQAWDAAEEQAARAELAVAELGAPAWIGAALANGRARDGEASWASADARVHPQVALLPVLVTVAGPGEVAGSAAPGDGPQPRIGEGHRQPIGRVWPSPDGRWVLTAGDGCRIWDLGRALPVGVLRRPDGQPIDAAIACWSPDGDAVTTVGEDGLVAHWDARRATLRWTGQVEVDDGSWASMVQGRAENRIFPDRIDALYGGRILRIVLAGHGRSAHQTSSTLLHAGDGSAAPDLFPLPQTATLSGALVAGFPEACLAVEHGDDGVVLQRWDAAGTQLARTMPLPWDAGPAGSGLLLLHADGRHLLAADDRGSALIVDLASGTVLRQAAIDPERACLVAVDRRSVILLGSADLPGLRAALAPFNIAVPPAERLAAAGLSLHGAGSTLELRDHGALLTTIPVATPAFSAARFAASDRLLLTADGQVYEIDLRLGVAVAVRPAPPAPPTADPWDETAPADPQCEGEDGRRWRIDRLGAWSTLAGQPGAVPPDPLRRDPRLRHTAIATAAGLHASCDRYRLTLRRSDGALLWWRDAGEPPEGALAAVAISPDGRLVATAGHGAALWRASDGALLARFACGPAGPIAVTADGRYAARGDPGPAISFRWLDETWPVTEFDLACNRPDLVVAAIGVADGGDIAALNRAWEARCRRLGVPPQAAAGAARLPRAMLDRAVLPLATDAEAVELSVTVDAVPAGSRLLLRLDDVPVPDPSGIPASAGTMRLRAPLAPGHNRIAVSLRLPDGREGLRDSAWTVRRGAAPPPRLHLLAVGCSRYRQAGLDLEFAAKDARDLAAAVASAATVLVDQAVQREGIAAAAAERFASAAPGDTAVLFLAGHGVLDDAGGYWFLTHDADAQHPQDRGLSFAAIEALLAATPARRRLVLLDTCHAGEADAAGLAAIAAPPGAAAGVRARGLRAWRANPQARGFEFLDLRSGIGAAVIASSAAAEFALESPVWANGVFTLAAIEGWGRGAADGDGDGAVRTSELAAYAARRVAELTAGAQTPALRSANRSHDAALPRLGR